MKIAALNTQYTASLISLRLIASGYINDRDMIYCAGEDKCYMYYSTLRGVGEKPYDLGDNDPGRWVVDSSISHAVLFPVDDAYDFGANATTEVTATSFIVDYENYSVDITIPARLGLYKLEKQIEVDNTIGDLFWAVLTLPNVSFKAQAYILIAHLFKGMQAQDVINDRDSKDLRPRAFRRNPDTTKKHVIIEEEAAKRGISNGDLADQIGPLSNIQEDFIAELEKIRPTSKDAIAAATDHAGVDAAWGQFLIDLSQVTSPSV